MVEGKTYGVLLTKTTIGETKMQFKKKYFHGKHTCRCAPKCPVRYDLLSGECENMTRLLKLGNIKE